MKKSLLLAITVSGVFGATIPNAGNVLQEMQAPKAPEVKKTIPKLDQKQQAPLAPTQSNVKILVEKFTITGNTVFSTETLHALVAKYEGKKLSLAQIEEAARIITEYYRKNSYFVAHAYVPAQEVDKGVITIKVQEGKYGTVDIENSSLVKDSVLEAYAQNLKDKSVISLNDLDRQMLLINDLGGARIVKASIFAGKTEGSSDFNMEIEPTNRIEAYALADNYGSIYTGEYRFGGGITVNSISGYGDILNISTIHSTSGGLRNGQLSYTLALGSSGLKADILGSITKYQIQGDEYASLDAHGQAGVIGGGFTYPIIRTQTHSTYVRVGAKTTHMNDSLNGSRSKKHVDDYTISLHDIKEGTLFGKKFSSEFFIQATRGKVVMDNDNAVTNDALIHSKGYFTKYELSLKETLYPTQESMIKMNINAQQSYHKNLDSSEEISVGGANGVRAYSSSELSGDRGVLLTLEADHNLPSIFQITHQAGIFLDTAKVWQNSVQYTGLSNDDRQLSDIGVSYILSYKDLNLKTSYAHGFGVDEKSQTDSTYHNDRFYIQLFAQF